MREIQKPMAERVLLCPETADALLNPTLRPGHAWCIFDPWEKDRWRKIARMDVIRALADVSDFDPQFLVCRNICFLGEQSADIGMHLYREWLAAGGLPLLISGSGIPLPSFVTGGNSIQAMMCSLLPWRGRRTAVRRFLLQDGDRSIMSRVVGFSF